MANSAAYKFGRFLGRLPTAAKLLLVAAVIGVSWWAATEPERSAKVKAAEIASYKRAINQTSASLRERVESIDKFSRIYPAEAKEFERLRTLLSAQASKRSELIAIRARQRELVRRKSEGVAIGMTQEEVLQSSWGRSERVNRSTNSFGIHEQWVYSSGSYLYFENGHLTSIQTSEGR